VQNGDRESDSLEVLAEQKKAAGWSPSTRRQAGKEMNFTRLDSGPPTKIHELSDPSFKQDKKQIQRDTWAKTLHRCHRIVRKASGTSCKVFVALLIYADLDGYCWPLISTLLKDTGIAKHETIAFALKELEALGVLDRQALSSKRSGNRAPYLYRIGGKIEKLPSNAAVRFVLPPRRIKKTSIAEHPEKERPPAGWGVGDSSTQGVRPPAQGGVAPPRPTGSGDSPPNGG